MRARFLRVFVVFVCASALSSSGELYAQTGAAPLSARDGSSGATPQDSNSGGAGTAPSGDISDQPRQVGGGVSAPVLTHTVNPEFSEQARKQKAGGRVKVSLIVDKNGLPQNVHVVRGIGMGLDEKAVEAVKQYKFKPAMEGGKPVAVVMNMEMNFQIIKNKAEADAAMAARSAPAGQSMGGAQPASTPSTFSVPGCAPDRTLPSEADGAMQSRQYADAERLYGDALTADPSSSAAMAGLVRATLADGKLPEALALALKYDGAHPGNPLLLDALGEVRFRRGEVDEAAMAFNKSAQLDRCNGVTHSDMARFLELSGMSGTAQRQLEVAHVLAPQNQEIAQRWRTTHAVSLRTEAACEVVAPVSEAKLPMIPISSLGAPDRAYEAGLEVQLNGKKRRLEIDTGASGLVLTSSVAKSAGLLPEGAGRMTGMGDEGPASSFVTHVDDVKVGAMEFKNCEVRVLEPGNTLEKTTDVDGLIGADFFRDYVVTLDFPSSQVRIGPLPKRPGDQSQPVGAQQTHPSIAESAKDRYVAPEMKDWTPVFRSAHFLIFPTVIGKAPVKLFVMDSGASQSLISMASAREVTELSGFTAPTLKGINGEVQKVLVADKVTIGFAGVSQVVGGMTSIDTASISRNVGVDISGFIGFPTLRELVISIDYRDNLVHVVYDPKKGYHAHN